MISRKMLGIDIQKEAVYAVLVRSGRKGQYLEKTLCIPLQMMSRTGENSQEKTSGNEQTDMPSESSGAQAPGGNPDTEPVYDYSEAFQSLSRQLDMESAYCVCGLSAEMISYRNMLVPFSDKKKIRTILPYELEPMLPFPVDNMALDFEVLPDSVLDINENRGQKEILAAAASGKDVSHILEGLARVGQDPEILSLSGYAACRCLSPEDNRGDIVFAERIQNYATLYILRESVVCFARNFPLRKNDETRSFTEQLKSTVLSFEDRYDTVLDLQKILVMDICEPPSDDSAQTDSSSAKDSSRENSQDEETEEEGANIQGTEEKKVEKGFAPVDLKAVESAMEVPAEPVDFHKLAQDSLMNEEPFDPCFLPAISLVMAAGRNTELINFRKGVYSISNRFEEYRGSLLRTGILLMIVLLVILWDVMLDLRIKKERVRVLDQKITSVFTSTFPEITNIVNPAHQMQVTLEEMQQNAFIPSDSSDRLMVVDILNDISRLIPENLDVALDRMVIDKENVLISGTTDTNTTVASVQNHLDKSDFFKKVEITSTGQKGGERVQFKLKVTL